MEERLCKIYVTLSDMAEKGQNVPLRTAAEICGVAPDTLRRGIESGKCPFGFDARGASAARGTYIISPFALWNWLTNGGGDPTK